MAAPADADQVSLSLSVGICVVNIQRKIRPELHMVNVMDQLCPMIPAFSFANLALVPVQLKYIGT